MVQSIKTKPRKIIIVISKGSNIFTFSSTVTTNLWSEIGHNLYIHGSTMPFSTNLGDPNHDIGFFFTYSNGKKFKIN